MSLQFLHLYLFHKRQKDPMQCGGMNFGNLDSFGLGIRFYLMEGFLWKFNPIYHCVKDFFNKTKIIWSIVWFGTLPLWRCVGSSWWPETCQRIFGNKLFLFLCDWVPLDFDSPVLSLCRPSSSSSGLVQSPRTRKCRARAEMGCRPVNRPVNKLLILMEELWGPYCRLVDFKSYVEF